MKNEIFDVIKRIEYELNVLGVSKKTIEAYKFHNEKFLEIIKKYPKNITIKDFRDYIIYLRNKDYAPATINLAIAAIKFYYRGIKGKIIFSRIKSVKREYKIPTVLTKEEIFRMIDSTANIKHKIMIKFLYSTGVRVGELVKLKIDDMFFDEKIGLVRSGKGRKDRYIKLSDKLIYDLRYYLSFRKDNNPYIFNASFSHITRRTAQEVVKKAGINACIKKRVHPHVLRATCATHLYDNLTDIRDIQLLLGHSKIDTTNIYVKKRPNRVKILSTPLD
ncbi:MAG: tyrosine-type recombinase/integrase [Nanoarchaeota archaeon]